ncbi:MAG: YbjN domain-containing protein [Candidatus Dormiibacterota bacterium]
MLKAEEFELLLRQHEHAEVQELEDNSWLISIPGHVRQKVNVAAVLRPDRISFYFFMVRAPRDNREAFYRLLLRKNLRTFAMKYCLDSDGDVWLMAEMPRRGFDAEELDRILGVFYQESESAFEALVHLGYPGVFPPLSSQARGAQPFPSEREGPGQNGGS